MIKRFIGAVFALSAIPAHPSETLVLELDDAIARAWSHDPLAGVYALQPEIAAARELQAGLRPPPEIEVSLATAAPFERRAEFAVGAEVSRQLPRRTRVAQAQAAARLHGERGPLELAERRRILAGEIRLIFYESAVRQLQRDHLRHLLDEQRSLGEAIKQSVARGEVSTAQRDLLAIEEARTRQELAQLEAEDATAVARLRGRLRVGPGTEVALRTSLEALLARPLPALPPTIDASRPELALAKLAVREAEAALALARAETRGDWAIGGGLELERRENDATHELENELQVGFRISAPWPRGVPNRGEILEKRAEVRVAEASLAALEAELESEIGAAIASAAAWLPIVRLYRSQISSGTEEPPSLKSAYERGEVSLLEFNDARQQWHSLTTEYIGALGRYAAALAAAETAAGVTTGLQNSRSP